MDFRASSLATTLVALTLSGCAAAPDNLTQAIATCNSGARYVEIRDSGIVYRILGERGSQSGVHEGFLIRFPYRANGAVTRVEDNVDITGPIPLRRGDQVTLQGQFECNDQVIHWTHHDPRGRHLAGYITVNGKTYQ
jgi:hypothetical protein